MSDGGTETASVFHRGQLAPVDLNGKTTHRHTHFPFWCWLAQHPQQSFVQFFFFFKAEAVKMNLNFHHMRPHWWKQNSDTSKDYSPHFGGEKKLVGFLSESETRRSVCLTRVCAVNMKLKPGLVIFTFCFFRHRLSKRDAT